MNHNEKLDIVERVERASEAQAKKTLKSMVLKCQVTHNTIARAIKDAVDRHCPTPHTVYEDPGSADEGEAAPTTSHKKKKKKKEKGHSGDSENKESVPNATSKKHRKIKRGDINPDPLVSQLIVKGGKSKRKGSRKANDDHDERHKNRVIIDLVTSSDSELSDNDSPEHKTAGGNPSVQAKFNRNVDLQEQERKTDETTPGKKAALNTELNSHNLQSQSVRLNTKTEKKAAKANGSVQPGSTGLTKKRKAAEHDDGDANDDQSHSSAIQVKRRKRSKRDHPREQQGSPKSVKCRKCRVKFQSPRSLAEHFQQCLITPYVPTASLLQNAPPPNTSVGPQIWQKADHSSTADVKGESHNIYFGASAFSRSIWSSTSMLQVVFSACFDRNTNNVCTGVKPSPPQQVLRGQEVARKPARFPIPVFEAGRERQLKCRHCFQFFRPSENHRAACSRHNGKYLLNYPAVFCHLMHHRSPGQVV